MVSIKTKSCIYGVNLGFVCQRSWILFAIAIVSLTSVVGHKLYTQPHLRAGTVAPQTLKAPKTSLIEDKKKTESQREAASKSFEPVLMLDAWTNEKIEQKLQQLLNQGNEIRASVGTFPYFDTFVLSLSTQRYLRSCSSVEWETLVLAIENNAKQKSALTPKQKSKTAAEIFGKKLPVSSIQDSKGDNFFQNIDFTQAISELETYRLKTNAQKFSLLIAQISQARQAYTQANAKLELATTNPETVYRETSLLELSDEDWAKTQIEIAQTAERILTQGIPPGLPANILQDAVNLQVQTSVPKDAEPLATKLLLAVLQPNLKKDEVQTKLKETQAAALVKPVKVEVRQGEVIVRKGEKITDWDFQVLEHYRLIRRKINWLGLTQLAGATALAIGIFARVQQQFKRRWRQRDHLLVLLLTLSTPLVIIMGLPYTTWSGIGLLLGSFYGSVAGVTVVGLMLLLLPLSLEVGKIGLLAGAAGGILGSCMAQRLRSREELALLSVAIALTQGGVYLIFKLFLCAIYGSASYIVLQQAGLFALSGLAWSIVALGVSPYLEKLFDLVTPIRLAELANPNRPLLKRLATETPGTFQHTLFVATLAEAAAKQLKCNVELVRAGVLYHDIGKIHDPLAFIENQMGRPNKHDTEINDPWKSAEIIKKHVSEGLAMARRHHLPTAIQAFIPEHQGTMQIAYFYHQAQEIAQKDPTIKVIEADFRYDGPIPQSRETAIVMLADSCEAALRSLKDTTSEQALAMLNNILRARWQDNQLLDSGLKREEMKQIAEIFVEVWQQFHHKRIAYPKLKAGNEKS